MRSEGFVILLAALACHGGSPRAAPVATDGRTPKAASGPDPAPRPAAASTYVEVGEIKALGGQVGPVKNKRMVVCGEPKSKDCVCVEPLPCADERNCITFDENVAAFRKALADKAPGRSVECRRAEIGECGGFRYFAFEGDIGRREVRWFDGTGHLVGQRSSTDYPAFCDGESRDTFQGRVPRCAQVKRTELICGTAESDLPLPIESLLKRRLTAGESAH